MYSGYEHCENAAIPGTEEYLDSEKYELKVRDWEAPGTLRDYVARINRVRREHPALQRARNLLFLDTDDDHVLCFARLDADGAEAILVAVNLDPFASRAASVRLPLAELGWDPDAPVEAHELLTDRRQLWRGTAQHVRLDPDAEPAAIFALHRYAPQSYGTPCH
jgi:starch synthase (maltosyl-transferring)